MNKQVDVYNGIIALIETLLPEYQRLWNPYDLFENTELYYIKGFSVGYGAGAREDLQLGCPHISINRTLSVNFTRMISGKETDPQERAAQASALIEDSYRVYKEITLQSVIGGQSIKAEFISDSGISYIYTNVQKYYVIEALFNILVME